MRRRVMLIAFGSLCALPALADPPMTHDEISNLTAAVAAQGCRGGDLGRSDTLYEVEDARCNDGREYGLKFDANFKLIYKGLER